MNGNLSLIKKNNESIVSDDTDDDTNSLNQTPTKVNNYL